ncbi:uncharacterized protein LOC113360915 isoform X2 [Papaver somniferum]|uniref:uncharacterized protein LOC113360915 isoform X2 n=1 Tax=Papaver somniferum TaxID=3469 RepID=UPI000E6FAF6E|nr:uncharacterized protein LOC113360915 isoform X2 [Papaver somniferum]
MGTQKSQKKKGVVKGKSKSEMGNSSQPDFLIPPHMHYGKLEINGPQIPSSSNSQPSFKIKAHNLSYNSDISSYHRLKKNQKEIFVPPLIISAPWPEHQSPSNTIPNLQAQYQADENSGMPISDTNKPAEDNGDGKDSTHKGGANNGDTQTKGDDADEIGEDQRYTMELTLEF